MSYKAIIARVYTRPHPNADRIQLGECRGYTVIVGKEVEDGTLGVLFPPDGQLSHEFALANELYARHPETGEKMKGFFDKNRRVRAQKFRGERSEAFWTELESVQRAVDFAGTKKHVTPTLREGDEFSNVEGVEICRKYETPATLRAKANRNAKAVRQNAYFAKHFDTDQLKRAIDEIPEGALLYFTEKLHGTSQRSGYVKSEDKEPTWRNLLGAWIGGIKVEWFDYEHLLGTRNVILGKWEGNSYYGKEGFRYKQHDRIKDKLHKGETVYYEIVGFTEEGSPIMPAVKTDALKDHPISPDGKVKFAKEYGETMWYTYGNWEADSPAAPRAMGGSEMYVYRITQQNADGISLDLSWEQVKGRCEELGVQHVPQLSMGEYNNTTGLDITDNFWLDRDGLLKTADLYAKGDSTLDRTHIREGVCVRWEKGKKMGILKHKSFEFLVLEGVVKTDEHYVDMEESS